MGTTTDKKLFSFREVIWFVSLALTFAGSHFPMKAKVNRMERTLEKYNLELIDYKLNRIQNDVDDINTKLDKVLTGFSDDPGNPGR